MRNAAAVAVGIAVAACGSSRRSEPEPAPTRVAVTVDGAAIGDALVPAGERVPLASLLPDDAPKPEQWRTVLLRSGAREVAAADLPSRYPNHVLFVQARTDGTATVGLYRAPSAGAPPHVREQMTSPRLSLDRVETIAITTKEPIPPKAARITLVRPDGSTESFGTADFSTIPRARNTNRQPGSNRKNRGRRLADVLAAWSGAPSPGTVTLVLTSGERVVVSVDAALIRTNARGHFVVTLSAPDAGARKWRGIERILL